MKILVTKTWTTIKLIDVPSDIAESTDMTLLAEWAEIAQEEAANTFETAEWARTEVVIDGNDWTEMVWSSED